MLKKAPSFVLGAEKASTCREEKSRSWAAQGWAGEIGEHASGFFLPATLLADLVEHPVKRY
jgi:hypothetical protein